MLLVTARSGRPRSKRCSNSSSPRVANLPSSDGFTAVRRGVRQQEANLGDFIRSSAQRKSPMASANRYRKLIVDDLNAISTSEMASRGGGHLLPTRQGEAKLAEALLDSPTAFPALSPSVQGEIGRRRVATPSSLPA